MIDQHSKPSDLRSVLIVTYGRSGSTLLQGLLNKIEGYRITGENNNALFWIYRASKQLEQLRNDAFAMSAKDPTFAFYGAPEVDYDLFYEHVSRLAYRLIVPLSIVSVKCYGFKEIRYVDFPDELEEYLDFLRRIFPACKIIFNTRSIEKVIKSGWWAQMDEHNTIRILTNIENKFRQYMNNNEKFCFHITYEDIVGRSQKLRELFTFLDEDYSEELLDSVLNTPHSTTG